jgi:hypothetical protein
MRNETTPQPTAATQTEPAARPWVADYCADGSAGIIAPKVNAADGHYVTAVGAFEGPKAKANIEFALRAVNCHDEMVSLLRRVLDGRTVKNMEPRGLMGEIAAVLAKAEAR